MPPLVRRGICKFEPFKIDFRSEPNFLGGGTWTYDHAHFDRRKILHFVNYRFLRPFLTSLASKPEYIHSLNRLEGLF